MEEKTYRTMGGSGALNIAVGVVSLVVGVAAGVLLIISGAKLLAGRNKILFKTEGVFSAWTGIPYFVAVKEKQAAAYIEGERQ